MLLGHEVCGPKTTSDGKGRDIVITEETDAK